MQIFKTKLPQYPRTSVHTCMHTITKYYKLLTAQHKRPCKVPAQVNLPAFNCAPPTTNCYETLKLIYKREPECSRKYRSLLTSPLTTSYPRWTVPYKRRQIIVLVLMWGINGSSLTQTWARQKPPPGRDYYVFQFFFHIDVHCKPSPVIRGRLALLSLTHFYPLQSHVQKKERKASFILTAGGHLNNGSWLINIWINK